LLSPDNQKNPVYAAMIESLDENIGRMIRVLEEKNLLENTVIIFAADNGTLMPTASSLPFRKGKGWCYEGGTRTPLMIYCLAYEVLLILASYLLSFTLTSYLIS
jgi:arylsulfatase A-like enzyme